MPRGKPGSGVSAEVTAARKKRPRRPRGGPIDVVETSARLVQEAGEWGNEVKSPDLQWLFTHGRELSPREKLVRNELFFLMWDLCGRSTYEVQKRTKMGYSMQKRILKTRQEIKEAAPVLMEQVILEEKILSDMRFKGRKALIELCYDGAQKGFELGVSRLEEMKPLDQIKSGAIMVDKALLLSGQPTSRMAKTDERMMSDAELAEKINVLQQRSDKDAKVH